MIDVARLIGTHDVYFITIDTLRYDVAQHELQAGRTPHLAAILPHRRWEMRHSPGSFTYAAHQAFFAGFFPTPVDGGLHPRPFAAHFPGSETTGPNTCVFDAPDIVAGLAMRGYHTVCIGGVGFFNKQSPLGNVLPGLFAESHWSPELGVADPSAPANQMTLAAQVLHRLPPAQRVFLFLNVSAVHPPNRFYIDGADADSLESHAAALVEVDRHLPRLLNAARRRGPSLFFLCSDHGTAYGEDGYWGHRVAHSVVWTVPYAEFVLDPADASS